MPLSARRWGVVTLSFLFVVVILKVVLGIDGFFCLPLKPFDDRNEFVALSGAAARRRMNAEWPSSIEPHNVTSASYKHEFSRDCFSTWFRIELSKEAAKAWSDHLHSQHDLFSSAMSEQEKIMERVQRTVDGPPPLRRQSGATPVWWSPPLINFRAIETMLWDKGYDSGVGRVAYSGFDESTGILWMYEYAAQHDRLWSPGLMAAE